MLRVREAQFDALERTYERAFVEDLHEELGESYPEVFEPLPVPVALRMIGRMVQRAESARGLSDESAIRCYLHYCAAVGPDFDDSLEIRAAIEAEVGTEEERLTALCDTVSEDAWDAADASTDMTRWFDDSAQGLRDREVALLAWALPDHVGGRSEEEIGGWIERAEGTGRSLGFEERYDVLTVAACMAVYGEGFLADEALTWRGDVIGAGHDPATVAELLRLRVLLDTGRSI